LGLSYVAEVTLKKELVPISVTENSEQKRPQKINRSPKDKAFFAAIL
jgi:hypothetical protein